MKLTRRRVLAGLAATFGVAALPVGWSVTRRYYDGPISDHFDGTHFFDPDGAPPKRFTELLRWWSEGGRAAWPERLPSPHSDTPPPRVTFGARLSFVGHVSWLIQTGGLNILVDPVWSERASPVSFAGPKRINDPGIAFEALPPIDIVLVSHGHYDHLDIATLSRLAARDNPRVITTLGHDTIMRGHDRAIRGQAHDWGERVELGPEVAVSLVASRHWTARGLTDRNKALWASFVLETPAGRIYIVCDSGYGTGVHFRKACAARGPFRLALLPIGAYEPRWFMRDQHMNPREAVMALDDCGAEFALAHHYGTFQLTNEPVDAPAMALREALAAANIASDRFRMLRPGQVLELA